jgi:AcrR family transcriptional regulator
VVDQPIGRGGRTRQHLVDVATQLFTERGYEATSIEVILEAAGVSRGALYHHFDGKEALFEAGFLAQEDDVGRQLQRVTAKARDAREALRLGCAAWIRIAGTPAVRQIVLLDAPAALGWDRWREIEERYALGDLKLGLGAMAADGLLPSELVDPFAHVLLAAVNEIALLVARAPDLKAAQRVGTRAVEELVDRLLGTGGP